MILYVYAPPGVGKSFLRNQLRDKGATVIDTDSVIETSRPDFSWDRYGSDGAYRAECVDSVRRFVAKAAASKDWVTILSSFKPEELGSDPDKCINIICSTPEAYNQRYALKGRKAPEWSDTLDTDGANLSGCVFVLEEGQFATSVENTILTKTDWADCRFYRSDNATRVVFTLFDNQFLVVKTFETGDCKSVKFWKGSLDKTASFWNTKEFQPSEEEAAQLRSEALSVLKDFRLAFAVASEAANLEK